MSRSFEVLRKICGALTLIVVVVAISPMLLGVLFLQWITDDWGEDGLY